MDKDNNIKEAFSKVKQDIFSLGNEISNLKLLIADVRNELKIITQALNDIKEKEILTQTTQISTPTYIPTQEQKVPTIQQITPTHQEIPTDKLLSQVLRSQKTQVSIGNEGVPTDKQTNRQTNQHIIQQIKIPQETSKTEEKETKKTQIDHLEKAAEILNSLDALKKEIRRKFKALTSQEIAVFSLLYQLEEQGLLVDYPLLSSKLKLSESSIRDYIIKIQKKGIPIIKEKLNNKRVILHISQDLKKIASLDTILKLREL